MAATRKPISKGIAKVPVIMQMETLECGAAALAMVMAYYGKWMPLEQVRVACGVSRDGTSIENVLKAAESYGVQALDYGASLEALQNRATFPCIVSWNVTQYVVCCGFSGNRVHINDPARGSLKIPVEEFMRSYSGTVILFEPTDAFEAGGKRKSMLEFARNRLRGAGVAVAFVALTTLIGYLFEMISPAFTRFLLDRLLTNDNAELLWHCGPFPPALSKEGVCIKDCKGSYQLKDGHLTLVRFDADHGTYKLFVEEADTCDGPKTTGNYVWFETKDWGKWEDKLMYGPYIHHIAGVYGSYKEVFREACKYLGVEFDCVD